jgi:hypothetical protein
MLCDVEDKTVHRFQASYSIVISSNTHISAVRGHVLQKWVNLMFCNHWMPTNKVSLIKQLNSCTVIKLWRKEVNTNYVFTRLYRSGAYQNKMFVMWIIYRYTDRSQIKYAYGIKQLYNVSIEMH